MIRSSFFTSNNQVKWDDVIYYHPFVAYTRTYRTTTTIAQRNQYARSNKKGHIYKYLLYISFKTHVFHVGKIRSTTLLQIYSDNHVCLNLSVLLKFASHMVWRCFCFIKIFPFLILTIGHADEMFIVLIAWELWLNFPLVSLFIFDW